MGQELFSLNCFVFGDARVVFDFTSELTQGGSLVESYIFKWLRRHAIYGYAVPLFIENI